MTSALVTLTAVIAAILLWRGFLKMVRPKYPDRTGNGIAAGPVKVYDNRFLSIRLDELESNLEKLGAIDPEKFDENVGTTQAKVESTSEASLTAGADANKQGTKGDGKESPAPSAPDGKLSQSARARLAEQINLRYELVGLRMSLERSLTDRLWAAPWADEGAPNEKEARLQAVLGLQVSLDPPASCKGCAAIVEVTLTSPSGEPVSLVALLPQERTNNALFANNRARSVSGAGEIKGRPFGLFWKRSRASSGLVAEAETVGFQRPAEPKSKALTVGWQFRPALESPAVTPGLRQVFAVVALPSIDPYQDIPGDQSAAIEAVVRTYWRRFDSKTGATSPRWSWIPWQLGSEERLETPQKVRVAFTEDILEELKPVIDLITTKQLGRDTVVVMVDGKNFFPGTTVAIGSKVHRDKATGLLIKSDQHMQITTAPEELVYGEGIVNGRYGPTVPLIIEPPVNAIKVESWNVSRSSEAGFQWLKVYVSRPDGTALRVPELADLPDAIVMVGDHVVSPPYYLWDDVSPYDAKLCCVQLQALVPAEWDPVTTPMRLTYPFCGKPYQLMFGMYDSSPQFRFSVVRWEEDSAVSLLISLGDAQFGDVGVWSVELGDREYPLLESKPESGSPDTTSSEIVPCLVRLSGTQIRLKVPAEKERPYETLVVHYKWDKGELVYPLQIPPPLTALGKPKLENEPVEVSSKTPTFIRIRGTRLNCVDKINFTSPGSATPQAADFSCSPDNNALTVFISASQQAGFGHLIALDKNQSIVGKVTVVVKD